VIKTNTHTSSVIPALHEITALEKLCAVPELLERIVLVHNTVSRKCECLNLDIVNLVAVNLMDLECRVFKILLCVPMIFFRAQKL
jgi:hypothetical protein